MLLLLLWWRSRRPRRGSETSSRSTKSSWRSGIANAPILTYPQFYISCLFIWLSKCYMNLYSQMFAYTYTYIYIYIYTHVSIIWYVCDYLNSYPICIIYPFFQSDALLLERVVCAVFSCLAILRIEGCLNGTPS